MKILKCAKEILKNTTEPYRQEIEYFISDYIHFGDGVDNQDLLAVFSKICEDGFNIQGFELYEIPHSLRLCFSQSKAKKHLLISVSIIFVKREKSLVLLIY